MNHIVDSGDSENVSDNDTNIGADIVRGIENDSDVCNSVISEEYIIYQDENKVSEDCESIPDMLSIEENRNLNSPHFNKRLTENRAEWIVSITVQP